MSRTFVEANIKMGVGGAEYEYKSRTNFAHDDFNDRL
jgi:hypothetical protein